MTWVAGIVHCIAMDPEISGSDDSLTGLTMSSTHLGDFAGEFKTKVNGKDTEMPWREWWLKECLKFGGTGSETGLKLRLTCLKGPKGDLICRIAERAMMLMGKKEGMFKDWEALRKHLTENKGLEPANGGKKIDHFSYLWTGPNRGGNEGKDFAQTYYERRYTPDLDDDTKFTKAEREKDRKAGGGGNPGLFAHCGFLLQRDHPDLYRRAKEAALADIANGLQVRSFEERRREQLADAREAERILAVKRPETKAQRKRLKRKIADAKLAEQYIGDAESALRHPAFQTWVACHPEAISRSYLASQQFTTVQIEQIEELFRQQSGCFTVKHVKGAIVAEGNLGEFRKKILAGSPVAVAPSPPAGSSVASVSVAAVEVIADLGMSMDEAAGTTSSASSTGSLTRQRSAKSDADDDEHRLKRSTRTKMSSKGPGLSLTPASPTVLV
jgi:hypothetical protein